MTVLKRFDLTGKVVAITGGGGELCGAMAEALGAMGVKVAVLDINLEKAEARVADHHPVRRNRQEPFGATCWIRPNSGSATRRSVSLWGAPDFLINGAGGNNPRGTTSEEFHDPAEIVRCRRAQSFFDLDPAGFRQVFDLNFMGTFLVTQAFSRGMVEKGKGSIVNISSMSAFTPLTKVACLFGSQGGGEQLHAMAGGPFFAHGRPRQRPGAGFFYDRADEVLECRSEDRRTLAPRPQNHRPHTHGPVWPAGRPDWHPRLAAFRCFQLRDRRGGAHRWGVFFLFHLDRIGGTDPGFTALGLAIQSKTIPRRRHTMKRRMICCCAGGPAVRRDGVCDRFCSGRLEAVPGHRDPFSDEQTPVHHVHRTQDCPSSRR